MENKFLQTQHKLLWNLISDRDFLIDNKHNSIITMKINAIRELHNVTQASIDPSEYYNIRKHLYCYACLYADNEVDKVDYKGNSCDLCPLIGMRCNDENEDGNSLYGNFADAFESGDIEEASQWAVSIANAIVKDGVVVDENLHV